MALDELQTVAEQYLVKTTDEQSGFRVIVQEVDDGARERRREVGRVDSFLDR